MRNTGHKNNHNILFQKLYNSVMRPSQWHTPVIPALWEAKVGGSLEVRSSRPAWPTWWHFISTKNVKISQAWWHMPVIPATGEAEAGESLKPKRWRLQWAEIVPLHSSLGDRDYPLSTSARITGVSHCAWPKLTLFLILLLKGKNSRIFLMLTYFSF